MNMNPVVDSAIAVRRGPALSGGIHMATGLLPRSLPRTTRPLAAKLDKSKRVSAAAPVEAALPARGVAAQMNPSFARMAACMRFRGYLAS